MHARLIHIHNTTPINWENVSIDIRSFTENKEALSVGYPARWRMI